MLRAALLLAALAAPGPAADFPTPLPIPPVLKPVEAPGGVAEYRLTAKAGASAFFPDARTATYGYNGMACLGPTIRLRRGRPARLVLRNALPTDVPAPRPMAMRREPKPQDGRKLSAHEEREAREAREALAHSAMATYVGTPNATSVHLHGLVVPAAADTLPSNCCRPLPPGSTLAGPVFTPDQPSATLWYHPHPYLDTGRQVYFGLAGMLLVDDPADAALDLPHRYGVDDLPLIVQDRRFAEDRSLRFRDREEDMEGMAGDRILVNGALTPHARVAATRVRLRLLNGSNARTFLFAFEDGRSFAQVATDGGLLPAPVALSEIRIPPAGRAEVVVDFGGDAGRAPRLVSRPFHAAGAMAMAPPLHNGAGFPVMEFRVGAAKPSRPLPAALAALPAPDPAGVTMERFFRLEDDAGGATADDMDDTINGRLFDMARVDEQVAAGAAEVWTVVNRAEDMAHPFHVHGVQFRVLDRSSGPLVPNDRGWKDTVEVLPKETVRILIRFDRRSKGVYMYHCHVLEHEDMGMMGQFEVGGD